jgi:hypothetical protein
VSDAEGRGVEGEGEQRGRRSHRPRSGSRAPTPFYSPTPSPRGAKAPPPSRGRATTPRCASVLARLPLRRFPPTPASCCVRLPAARCAEPKGPRGEAARDRDPRTNRRLFTPVSQFPPSLFRGFLPCPPLSLCFVAGKAKAGVFFLGCSQRKRKPHRSIFFLLGQDGNGWPVGVGPGMGALIWAASRRIR